MPDTIESKDGASPRTNMGELASRFYNATVGKFLRGDGRSAWDFSGYGLILPEMRQKVKPDGMAGPDLILDLAASPTFASASYYLLIKAMQPNPEAQRSLLEYGVNAESKAARGEAGYKSQLRNLVEGNIALLPAGTEVMARKVLQEGKAGTSVWERGFETITDRLVGEYPNHDVFVQAYASLLGFEQFARFSRINSTPINLMIEDWYEDPSQQVVGYRINAAEGRVRFLNRNFRRPANYVLVDDAVRTWDHMRRLDGFISKKQPNEVVVDTIKALFVYRYDEARKVKP